MQVVEVNASFVSMIVACMAVIGCILVGIFYGYETKKKFEKMKRHEEIKLKSAYKMGEYEARKAEEKGYNSGYEMGYQQALVDVKTGKVKTGLVKGGDKDEPRSKT